MGDIRQSGGFVCSGTGRGVCIKVRWRCWKIGWER